MCFIVFFWDFSVILRFFWDLMFFVCYVLCWISEFHRIEYYVPRLSYFSWSGFSQNCCLRFQSCLIFQLHSNFQLQLSWNSIAGRTKKVSSGNPLFHSGQSPIVNKPISIKMRVLKNWYIMTLPGYLRNPFELLQHNVPFKSRTEKFVQNTFCLSC